MIKKNTQIVPYIFQGNLETYIKNINIYPVLTCIEEKFLTKKLYYKNDLIAAKNLILSNLRFVIHIANKYKGYGLIQLDLIQEGNIGLMKALEKYNPNIGVRLISFAIHWIKAEIHEYILRNWRIIRIATTKLQKKLFFNLRKKKLKLNWLNKNEINLISKKFNIKNKDIYKIKSNLFLKDKIYSIKNTISFILKNKFLNFINNVENENWHDYNHEKLNKAIEKLDNRSKNIIYERWLLVNKNTLNNISFKYKVSIERVRQLEKTAIIKIKKIINKYKYKYKYY